MCFALGLDPLYALPSHLGPPIVSLKYLQIASLKSLGHTIIYSPNLDHTAAVYTLFPTITHAVVLDPETIEQCQEYSNCLYDPTSNPTGLPIYKIFAFSFWSQAGHPLGGAWTINPEPYNLQSPGLTTNTYIGYSVQDTCASQPFVTATKRRKSAYIMGKLLRFFQPSARGNAWSEAIFDAASNATGVEFLIGAVADPTKSNDPASAEAMTKLLPASLTNLGHLEQVNFLETLSEMVALVGIGDPATQVA